MYLKIDNYGNKYVDEIRSGDLPSGIAANYPTNCLEVGSFAVTNSYQWADLNLAATTAESGRRSRIELRPGSYTLTADLTDVQIDGGTGVNLTITAGVKLKNCTISVDCLSSVSTLTAESVIAEAGDLLIRANAVNNFKLSASDLTWTGGGNSSATRVSIDAIVWKDNYIFVDGAIVRLRALTNNYNDTGSADKSYYLIHRGVLELNGLSMTSSAAEPETESGTLATSLIDCVGVCYLTIKNCFLAASSVAIITSQATGAGEVKTYCGNSLFENGGGAAEIDNTVAVNQYIMNNGSVLANSISSNWTVEGGVFSILPALSRYRF